MNRLPSIKTQGEKPNNADELKEFERALRSAFDAYPQVEPSYDFNVRVLAKMKARAQSRGRFRLDLRAWRRWELGGVRVWRTLCAGLLGVGATVLLCALAAWGLRATQPATAPASVTAASLQIPLNDEKSSAWMPLRPTSPGSRAPKQAGNPLPTSQPLPRPSAVLIP